MKIPEFIDTYSDDIIFLQEARDALLSHPLKRTIKDLCDASFCRMFAIIMIGNIETMIEHWKNREKMSILDVYFAKKAKNDERVQSLYRAFHKAGINVDRQIFDDYLAVKYLRNTIIHGHWKEHEKEWLDKCGFPSDSRELTEKHWKRMHFINQNMMFYIALTSIAEPSKKLPDKVIKLPEIVERNGFWLLKKRDIPDIFWSNLEKISEYIYKDIERTVLTQEYNWAECLSDNEIREKSREERKRLFYLAARRAGEEGFHLLAQHQDLARDALYFWKEYWHLTFDQVGISLEDITRSVEVLSSLHQRCVYPRGPFVPWHREMPPQIAIKMIQSLLEGYEPRKEEEIIFALNIGDTVYNIRLNITAVYLLMVQLPIVDPENTAVYLKEGEKALAAMELIAYWYFYVERRSMPDIQGWAFYRQMCNELRRRCK